MNKHQSIIAVIIVIIVILVGGHFDYKWTLQDELTEREAMQTIKDSEQELVHNTYYHFMEPVDKAFDKHKISDDKYHTISDYVWSKVSRDDFGGDYDCEQLEMDIKTLLK